MNKKIQKNVGAVINRPAVLFPIPPKAAANA